MRNPKTTVAGDITLLENAAQTWKQFTKLWENYCVREREKEIVRPILVVQVEDGTDKIVTRTPLDDVVRVIERHSGPLGLNEIVHCFQDATELSAGGRIIRKLEASRIQDSPDVKVVLFKTALTTGWDCPRAEGMMSFRRSQEPTSIAQLVGRTIRTPLARRIGTDEVLDTVELFLPHYDSEALEEVLKRLRNPEAEEGVSTRVETSAAESGDAEAIRAPQNPAHVLGQPRTKDERPGIVEHRRAENIGVRELDEASAGVIGGEMAPCATVWQRDKAGPGSRKDAIRRCEAENRANRRGGPDEIGAKQQLCRTKKVGTARRSDAQLCSPLDAGRVR